MAVVYDMYTNSFFFIFLYFRFFLRFLYDLFLYGFDPLMCLVFWWSWGNHLGPILSFISLIVTRCAHVVSMFCGLLGYSSPFSGSLPLCGICISGYLVSVFALFVPLLHFRLDLGFSVILKLGCVVDYCDLIWSYVNLCRESYRIIPYLYVLFMRFLLRVCRVLTYWFQVLFCLLVRSLFVYCTIFYFLLVLLFFFIRYFVIFRLLYLCFWSDVVVGFI